MRLMRRIGAVCLTAALLALPAPATHNPNEGHHTLTGPVVVGWEQLFNGPLAANSDDVGLAVAVNPDGSRVFVTGRSNTIAGNNFSTVAYDARSGAQVWAMQFNGPAGTEDRPNAIAVSPDGAAVIVTGQGRFDGTGFEFTDYATVGYDAATGTELWAVNYDGPGHQFDEAVGVTVSPDSGTVFVTGLSQSSPTGDFSGMDYATVAYDAANGDELWATRFDGAASFDAAEAIGVNAAGTRVFVTGQFYNASANGDWATVAYDAATGEQLWAVSHDGTASGGGDDQDSPFALAVSPDGVRVVVTGQTLQAGLNGFDLLTISYDTLDGDEQWATAYAGPFEGGADQGTAVTFAPDGSRVFVTGQSFGGLTGVDIVTQALDPVTGTPAWTKVFNGPNDMTDVPFAIAACHQSDQVMVTGVSRTTVTDDAITVAYDAADGTQVWTALYEGPNLGHDTTISIAASPTAPVVFTAGLAAGVGSSNDFVTLALCAAGTFSDVTCTNGAWLFIEAVVAAGIASGFPDGTYRPDNTVNRGQMAVFMARTADLDQGDFAAFAPPACGSETFSDVDCAHFAFKFVEYIVVKGIASGFPDGTYKPGNAVSRGAMAVFLSRVRDLFDGDFAGFAPPACGSETFPDVLCTHASFKFIEYVASKGIASGFGDGTYRPNNAVNRGQMAIFVARTASLPL